MGVEWNNEFMPKFRAEVVKPALDAAMIAAQGYAIRNIQTIPPRITSRTITRGGRTRTRSRKIKSHSRPGEFPNSDTGNLRNSISVSLADPQTLTASFGVYGGAKKQPHRLVVRGTARGYGMYLERGTRRMKPRPFLAPTAQRAPMAKTFAQAAQRLYSGAFGV